MTRILFVLTALFALMLPAAAQVTPGSGGAIIVATCGTPPVTYPAGQLFPLTQDTTGKLCTSSAGGAPQSVKIVGNPVTYTDKSGTITSGGVAQTLMASNTSRNGFLLQNLSSGDLWISSLGTAAANQPSLWLPAGAYYEPPLNGVPTAAISIFGATTSQAFAAREW